MKNSYAVRGATTVEMDSPAAMDEAVCELFEEMLRRNELDPDDIVYIIASQTSDLKSKNTATCLRKTGRCDDIPLFCVHEAEITGMMPRVIRLMVVVGHEKTGDARMVYLRRAAALRPDLKME